MSQTDSRGDLKDISTLQEVLHRLTVNAGNNPALPSRLISQVICPDTHIYGTDVEYRLLIKMLRERGEHFLALDVCRYLLNNAPAGALDQEALSEALLICAESARLFQEGKRLFRQAELEKPIWSKNLFYAAVRFLRSLLAYYPSDQGLICKAGLFLKDYLKRFPEDKRAYREKAGFLIDAGRKSEAESFLRHYLLETQKLIDAKCCLLLIQLTEQDERFGWSDSCEIVIKLAELSAMDSDIDRKVAEALGLAKYEAMVRKAYADQNTGAARDALNHISEIRNHTQAQKGYDMSHHMELSDENYQFQNVDLRQDLLVKYTDRIV